MRQLWLFFSHVIKMALSNKLRFALLLFGIIVGLFGFSIGRMCLNSYYESLVREINEMPEDTLYVMSEDVDEEITRGLFNVSDTVPTMTKISSQPFEIFCKEKQGINIHIQGLLNGISNMNSAHTMWDMQYGINMSKVEIVQGRGLSQTEINLNEKKCIIDEYTAELMFDESAVGKTIMFNYWDQDDESMVIEYEVVGVMKDTYYSRKNREYVKDALEDGDNPEEYIYTGILCPYGYDEYLDLGEYPKITYLWNKKDVKRSRLISEIGRLSAKFRLSPLTDKESEMESADYENRDIKYAIKYGTWILLAITGVFSMSVMFFAMKERASEIAIKKAFGADAIDMFIQFNLEIIFISVIASSIAFGLSCLGLNCTAGYITQKLSPDYVPIIGVKDYLIILVVGIVQNILFTFIPVIVYSCKHVVKVLKTD